MKTLKFGIALLIIFIGSVYLAFYFEDYYERLIRYLFETLSSHKVSFFHTGKYFRLPSEKFVLSFGFFMVIIILLLKKQSRKQIINNLILGFLILIISTILYCYIDSSFKVIECTTCTDGKRILDYGEVAYDMIFFISLAFSILPVIINELKNMNRPTCS
jgi:hypothetical protein